VAIEESCANKHSSTIKLKIIQNEELKKQYFQHSKNRLVYLKQDNDFLYRSQRFSEEFLEKLTSQPIAVKEVFKHKRILNLMPIDEALQIFSKAPKIITEFSFKETISDNYVAKINSVNMKIPLATAVFRICDLYVKQPIQTFGEAIDLYCQHNEDRYQSWLKTVNELAKELSISEEDVIFIHKHKKRFNQLDFDNMGNVYMNKYYNIDTHVNRLD